MLADCVPNPLPTAVEAKADQPTSISSMNIPLVSYQPVLAVSPKYILLNETTKRNKQWVLLDEHLRRTTVPCKMKDPVLDAAWCQVEEKFFLLTSTKVYAFDPKAQTMDERTEFKSVDHKPFKCLTYSTKEATLWIAYDEWQSEFIDQWKRDEENQRWQLTHRQAINLTNNEFVGNITATVDDQESQVAISIFNCLIEQWRMEVHHAETWICLNTIILPGSSLSHDYRMIPIQTQTCDVQWLAYSQLANVITAIDSKWHSLGVGYRSLLHRVALFGENRLIIRNAESVDILLFS